MRRLGLIYRRDKALSKAALGFIQIVLENLEEHRVGSGAKASEAGYGIESRGNGDGLPGLSTNAR